MAIENEQTLADVLVEQRSSIKRDTEQLRNWLKDQSAADIEDTKLSAAQHAMALRIHHRSMRTGTDADQATNQELDEYFIEAKIFRDVVPLQIASVQQGIDDSARIITTILVYSDLVEKSAMNGHDRSSLENAHHSYSAGF